MIRKLVIASSLAILLLGEAFGQPYDPKIDQQALQMALDQYTSCQKACAVGLATDFFNAGVEGGLKLVGAAATFSKDKKVGALAFYAAARGIYQSGKKVIETEATCSGSCDDLNKEIVALGRAGLLGPMLKGGKVDKDALDNARVFNAYIKYIKPIPLPAEERSKEWWKYIQSLS
jgi:hypothetical protein